jgi:hypothetical protein
MLFAFEFVSILQYKYIAMGITKTEYFTEEQNGWLVACAIIEHLIK